MKRWLVFTSLLAAGPLAAQEESIWGPTKLTLPPFDRAEIALQCALGRESQALVIGNGRSALAVYVFDPKGNCVGFDDEPSRVIDDRIVAWTPAVSGSYGITFRNLGGSFNTMEAAAK